MHIFKILCTSWHFHPAYIYLFFNVITQNSHKNVDENIASDSKEMYIILKISNKCCSFQIYFVFIKDSS